MFASKEHISSALRTVRDRFRRPGLLSLVGECSLVVEGILPYCTEIILAAEVDPTDRPHLVKAIDGAAQIVGLTMFIEHPADVIPVPPGTVARSMPVTGFADDPDTPLLIRHFDPYTVAIRFMARGDEPDYNLVLDLLGSGWISMEGLEREVAGLLPRFSFETIQQDPAEFRRKFKGLKQMWNAAAPA